MARADFARYDAIHARLWDVRNKEDGSVASPPASTTATTTGSASSPSGRSPPGAPASLAVVGSPTGMWTSVLEPQARLTFLAMNVNRPSFPPEAHLEDLASDFILFADHEPFPPSLPPPSPLPSYASSLPEPYFTNFNPLLDSCHAHPPLPNGVCPRSTFDPPAYSFACESAGLYGPPFGAALALYDPFSSESAAPKPSAIIKPQLGRHLTILPPISLPGLQPALPSSSWPPYAYNDEYGQPAPPIRRPAYDACLLPSIKPSPLDSSLAAQSRTRGTLLHSPPGLQKPSRLWSPVSPNFSPTAVAEPENQTPDDKGVWPFPPLPPGTSWPTPTSEPGRTPWPNALGLTFGWPTDGCPPTDSKPRTQLGPGVDLMAQVLDASGAIDPKSSSSSPSPNSLALPSQIEVDDAASAVVGTRTTTSDEGLAQSYAQVLGTGPRRWSRTALPTQLGSGVGGGPIATDRPTSALRLDTTSDSSTAAEEACRQTPYSDSPPPPLVEGLTAPSGRVTAYTPPGRRPPSNEPTRSCLSERTDSDILMSSSPAFRASPRTDPPAAVLLAPVSVSKRPAKSPDGKAPASASPSPRETRPKRIKLTAAVTVAEAKLALVSPVLRKSTLPASAVTAFSTWYDAHKSTPYPSADEKKGWVKNFEVTRTQVDDWFINKRRRAKIGAASASGSVDVSKAKGSSLRTGLRPR